MDSSVMDFYKLPIDIVRNLDFSNNEYRDHEFFGACLWDDEKYFKLETALVQYFQRGDFGREIFPILNQFYFQTKRCAYNTIDYQTCTDSCDNFTIDDRINHFRYLIRHGMAPDDGYKPSSGEITKTIEYVEDKNCIHLPHVKQTCNTVSVVAYGFTNDNRYKFKELSYIGLFTVLSTIDAANTYTVDITKALQPLRLFLVTQDMSLVSGIKRSDDDFVVHKTRNNCIALEFPIMHHAIYNKFKLDYYGIFYDNYERCSIIMSQKFHKDFFSIFDDDGFVVLEKIVDLAYKRKMMFLHMNKYTRNAYCKLDIASASFKELSNVINHYELKRRIA